MNDCIIKEIAIAKLKRIKPCRVMSDYGLGYVKGLRDAIDILNATPSADVQPVRRGQWENECFDELLHCYSADCSECGYNSLDLIRISISHKYCEYCGTRMIQEGETE